MATSARLHRGISPGSACRPTAASLYRHSVAPLPFLRPRLLVLETCVIRANALISVSVMGELASGGTRQLRAMLGSPVALRNEQQGGTQMKMEELTLIHSYSR